MMKYGKQTSLYPRNKKTVQNTAVRLFSALLQVMLAATLCACDADAPIFSTDRPAEEQSAALPAAPLSPVSADRPVVCLSPDDAPPVTDRIRMNFVGDVMLASENGDDGFWSFNLFAYDTPADYYFAKMQDIFANDDWTVANCENVFTDRVNPEKTAKEEDPGYWYYSGTENARIFAAGSVEIVSLANNHALDYGYAGRDDTAAAIEAAGVSCVTEGKSVICEKAGVRVALLCVSMYSEYYLTPILDWLSAVSETTDFQIVYYHGGTERVHEPDAWRVRASRAMVDAGADLVLGNHPHVLQPIETYNGVEIVYSLGNFLFGGSHTCENRTMVYTLTLDILDGMITGVSGEVTPCYCYGELWQPTPITDETERETVFAFLRGERENPY